jgi:DNA-binding transcriptional LysR family regulator
MHEYTHRTLLEESVRNGVGDVALGPVPLGWTGAVERLGCEELVVVLPLSDPLAGRERVRLDALADRHWIMFPPGHGLTEVVTSACRHAGFQPQVSVRTTQVEAAARLAAAGLGPAMVPDNAVAPGLPARAVRTDPPIARELAAYARGELTAPTTAFVEALREGPWAPKPLKRAVMV